jgi:hypothetical protein
MSIQLTNEAHSPMTTLAVHFNALLPTLTLRSARANPRGVQLPAHTYKRKSTLNGCFLLCMEVRGVEPLSENIATQASTGVVTVLMSPEHRPVTGYALGQPDCLPTSDPRRRPNVVSHYS